MTDEDRIDLSALDPSRDREAWGRFVDVSIARAEREAELAREAWWEVLAARRRSVAIASALAAAAGVLALARPAAPAPAPDPATALLAPGGQDPTVLLTVGGAR